MDKNKDTDIPKIFCHTEQIQIVDKGKALVVYYESAVAYEDPF